MISELEKEKLNKKGEIFQTKYIKFRKKKLIIDLSPDFRIKDITIWKKWYKMDHTEPVLLKNSVYGLSEHYKKELQNTKFISI